MTGWFGVITNILVIALLAVAVYTDIRFGKIYNKVTLPCLALGLAFNAAHSGLPGLVSSLGGVLVVLIPFLLFASVGAIGGGDIKLMMAVGALKGFEFTIWAVLFGMVLGGVLALTAAFRHGIVLVTLRNIVLSMSLRRILGARAEMVTSPKQLKVKYSLAIAAGVVIALLKVPGRI